MSISCIAIDDDPHSLESLVAYMDKLPDLKLINTFTEPLKALAEISAANPVDIIFMDVEMPTLSGIELARLIREKTKHLVFTTAHAKYAIDAFKVDADAYLLKPYSILHFAKTIHNLYPTGKNSPIPFTIYEDQYFYIPLPNQIGDLAKIDLYELISVEHLGEDTQFKTSKDLFISPKPSFAKTVKMLMSCPAFIQISQTLLISKQHIKSVLGNNVLLSNETLYVVDITHKNLFDAFIELNSLKRIPKSSATE